MFGHTITSKAVHTPITARLKGFMGFFYHVEGVDPPEWCLCRYWEAWQFRPRGQW